MFCKIVAILLFVNVSNSLYYRDPYTIPEPRVEVLKPRGFRISIEDSPGISRVAFYVNINKELSIREPTDFFGNINAVHGRWTFDESNAVLKFGDVLSYVILVTKDRLDYQTDERGYLYADDQLRTTAEPPHSYLNKPSYFKQAHPGTWIKNDESGLISTTQSPESHIDSYAHSCEHFLLNCSQTLLTVQFKMETLSKLNQQLISFIEKYPDVKILTLSGRIPPDDDPIKTVNFILREKLELNPCITSAVRNNDNSIKFEVDALLDKLEILEVAKEKLKHSRIFIS